MVLDKDIHQQNTTERPEINPYICRRLISDKCARIKAGESIVSSTSAAEKTRYLHVKE